MKNFKWLFILMLSIFMISCADEALEDEADSSSDIIQTNGFNSLITITSEELGENCETGGKRIDTGLDNGGEDGIENDGILQESEIDSTEYVCNGINGKDGENGTDGTNGTGGQNGEDGSSGTDGVNGDDGADSSSDIIITYDLSGNLQKGPCLKDGKILIQPLDASMDQIGTHYTGFTKDDFGAYDIPADIPNMYAEVFFEGDCHNEMTGGFGSQRLSGIVKVTDPINNINPLTKIRSQVARWLFDDGFGDVDKSLIEAEKLILLYLGMPVLDKRFTEMDLEQNGIHDAVLALINSMILYGRSGAEQGDYIVGISNGVINNDLDLKAEIANDINSLPLMKVKNNLESRYEELGKSINMPPIWRLGAPAYYADLLERTPIVISIYNLTDNTTCSFDQSVFNLFAVPHVFDSAIETSRYIALNFPADANISIWTVGVDRNGKPAPGVKLLDIEGLREIILDNPVKLSYNGFLGDDHGLTAGIWYYLRIRKDENFTLSKGCGGTRLYTYYTLASKDEGINWIGDGINSGKFFYFSGIKMYTTD